MTRFLVVDDNPLERKLYEAILMAHHKGSLIDFAGDGLEALQKCASGNYSAIITDIEMPRMNGIEFFRHLREISSHLQEKTLFVSTNIERHRPFLEKTKVAGCLEKPFEKSVLLEAIDFAMSRVENCRRAPAFQTRMVRRL